MSCSTTSNLPSTSQVVETTIEDVETSVEPSVASPDQDSQSTESTNAASTPTSRSGTPTSNSSGSKRKRYGKVTDFEHVFMEQMKDLKKMEEEEHRTANDSDRRFGEEVADSLSKIDSEYTKAVAMREIRDVIFKHRFPAPMPPPPPPQEQQQYQYQPQYTNLSQSVNLL